MLLAVNRESIDALSRQSRNSLAKLEDDHEHHRLDYRRHHRGLARRADHGTRSGLVHEPCRGRHRAIIGGFLFSSLLGFEYQRGLNLASIAVATVGAVVFLYLLGMSGRRTSV